MGKIDLIIYLIIFVLILVGFSKGFFRQILSTANWLISLILAIIFVKPFSKLMNQTSWQSSINTKISDWISQKGAGLFNLPYNPSTGNQELNEAITEGLNLPKFIADIITNGINFDVPEGTTLVEIIAPAIGVIIMGIISFIILFFLFLIIIKLVINLLNIVFDGGILGVANKFLGALLGLLKGIVLVSLGMLLLTLISSVVPSIYEFLVVDLKLDQSSLSIGKYFYEKNPILEIIKGSFSFQNILNYLKVA